MVTKGRLLFVGVLLLLFALYADKKLSNEQFLEDKAKVALNAAAEKWKRFVQTTIEQADPLLEFTALTLSNTALADNQRWILENAFKAYLKHNQKKLFQVRLLSKEGMELIRVETNGGFEPTITPIDKLQDKSHRDYFLEASHHRLNKGQYYLSDISLNKENGAIDPRNINTLRFITAIHDQSGIDYYLVLNAYANIFLESIDLAVGEFSNHLYISTAAGYLVKKPNVVSIKEDFSTLQECCSRAWKEIISHPYHDDPLRTELGRESGDLIIHLPITDSQLSTRVFSTNRSSPEHHHWHSLLRIKREEKADLLSKIYLNMSRSELNPAGRL